MPGNEATLWGVFLAGILSFFSPCVLPIIPAYLSLISGVSFNELSDAEAVSSLRWRLIGSALGFVVGFGLVTILLLGSLASLATMLNETWKAIFRYAGGIVVLIFALHMFGIFRINALYNERRFHLSSNRLGVLGAVLVGAAFAFGWSPCIGPTLAAVFALAGNAPSAGTAWALLVAYTIGMALPFVLAAIFTHVFINTLRKLTRYARGVEIASGTLLLAMGIVLVTDKMGWLNSELSHLTRLIWR